MKATIIAIFTALSLAMSGQVMAIGEVLKINTKGVQYCAGSAPISFNSRTDIDLWLSIDSNTAASVYANAGLTMLVARLDVKSVQVSTKTIAFSAFTGATAGHIAVIGTFGVDVDGQIKSVKATMVRRGVIDTCHARASLSGNRVQ